MIRRFRRRAEAERRGRSRQHGMRQKEGRTCARRTVRVLAWLLLLFLLFLLLRWIGFSRWTTMKCCFLHQWKLGAPVSSRDDSATEGSSDAQVVAPGKALDAARKFASVRLFVRVKRDSVSRVSKDRKRASQYALSAKQFA